MMASQASERELRDDLLQTLRLNPWATIEDLDRMMRPGLEAIETVLEDLVEEDLVDVAGDGYAIQGTKRPPTKRYKERSLGESADHMETIVREHPWERASFYAEKKGNYRNAAYNQLDVLTERGRLTMTIKDGVKHWGPCDEEPPEGHMKMQPGARSPVRQALKPRILSLLNVTPWQTTATITDLLQAKRKSVGNAIRSLLSEEELTRESIPYQGKRTVWAYALPESPPLDEEHRDRIQDEQRDRLPDSYGAMQDRILKHIQKHPWRTARQITDTLTNVTMGQIQSGLSNLIDQDRIQRVADGEYRYALIDAELTRNVTGHLKHGGKTSKQLDAALHVLEEHIELPTKTLRDHVEERLDRECPGLHHQLKRAQQRDILDSYKTTRDGNKVRIWRIEQGDPTPPSDHLGEIQRHAKKLREKGWTINIQTTPPTGGPP